MTANALECRRGRTTPTTAASPTSHVGVAWRNTTSAAVLAKTKVQELNGRGDPPDPPDVLLVRLRPGAATDWTVTLRVLYAGKDPVSHSFPFTADPARLDDEGAFAVAFAFARGPEALDGVRLPYVHVVDVTEGTAHAPRVEVSGLGAAPIPIQLDGAPGPGPEPEKLLECVCVPGVTFDFDSSFLRPSVVECLKKIDQALQKNPQGKLFIAGHTDRVGSDQYNKDLADRRAYSVYCFITNDAHGWELLYQHERWGLRTSQVILKDLGHDPGDPDGIMGPKTQGAMRSFLGLPPSDAPVPYDFDFRRQLFLAYMTGKHDVQATPEQFVQPRFTGCGEFNPVVAANAAELANAAPGNEPNRRVVVFVFGAPPAIPCLIHDTAPCRAEINKPSENGRFACAFYDRISALCDCETTHPTPPPKKETPPPPPSGGEGTLDVRVLMNGDPKAPYAGALVALWDIKARKPAGAYNTNAAGYVAGLKLPAGAYSVSVKTPSAEWTDEHARADVFAGKHKGIVVPVFRQGVTVKLGTLTATVTKGGAPVPDKRVNVLSDDGSKRPAQEGLTGANGKVTFGLEPGVYLVSSSTPPFAFQVTITAGKNVAVHFDGKMPPGPGAELDHGVPWDQLFNQQFEVCLNTWMAFQIVDNFHPGAPPVPGAPSMVPKARPFVLDCMRGSVEPAVAAQDAATPDRPPQAGRTKEKLGEWAAKPSNKKKLDDLPK